MFGKYYVFFDKITFYLVVLVLGQGIYFLFWYFFFTFCNGLHYFRKYFDSQSKKNKKTYMRAVSISSKVKNKLKVKNVHCIPALFPIVFRQFLNIQALVPGRLCEPICSKTSSFFCDDLWSKHCCRRRPQCRWGIW